MSLVRAPFTFSVALSDLGWRVAIATLHPPNADLVILLGFIIYVVTAVGDGVSDAYCWKPPVKTPCYKHGTHLAELFLSDEVCCFEKLRGNLLKAGYA